MEIEILRILSKCLGPENAIKRMDLLFYLKHFAPDINDREMRRLVKNIPQICSCERGYYIAKTKEEADLAIEYLKKKIFPLWEDIKRIKEAYPQFYKDEQLDLFRE